MELIALIVLAGFIWLAGVSYLIRRSRVVTIAALVVSVALIHYLHQLSGLPHQRRLRRCARTRNAEAVQV